MSLPRGAVRAFVDALAAAQRRGVDLAALEPRLSDIVEQARARWKGVDAPVVGYLEHLAAKLAGQGEPVAALSKLKTDDLYIAFACARGAADAVERLEAKFRDDVFKALGPYRLDAGARDEVMQRLRERLFVGRGRPAKVHGYAGSGPLAGWICASAVRVAIDLGKETRPSLKADDEEVADRLQDPADLELAVIKQKYTKEFRAAFQIAFRALTAEERNLIRFNFIDGLNIEQIGAMQNVHRSTIARRISRIREQLYDGTRKALREKFHLTSSEVNSLLRLVKSDFDVSIHEALREPRSVPNPR